MGDKDKRIKLKRSVSSHFAMVFVVLLLLVLLFVMLVNSTFLQEYYKNSKRDEIRSCYERIDELFANTSWDVFSEEFQLEFERAVSGKEFSVIVVNSALQVVAVFGDDNERVVQRLFSYIFKDDPNYLFRFRDGEVVSQNSPQGSESEDGDRRRPPDGKDGIKEDVIIESASDYEIRMSLDPRMGNDYIELVGTLSSGDIVFIRAAVEGIRGNVRVSNRFMLYVALIALVIGTLMIIGVTRKITRPILELAKLSEKMTNLDFQARYKGSEDDEIGYLGTRMNRMSEKLQSTIAELKTANNELKVDLEKRERLDEMRSDFISNVSHELKTPIAIIQGYAEGLKDAVNDDPESRDYYCEVIMDEAGKMNRMVQNLLTLNQLEFGRDVVSMECFDVAELVRNYVDSARILIEQTGAQVEITGEKSMFVWGDEYKIEEVVANYFSNALHHVSGDMRIVISIERREGNARVSVFNSGNPIPGESLDMIWTKFYKADKARSREYGGSGVGLSIVKAIMESHHMPYGVVNGSEGPTFYFELETRK